MADVHLRYINSVHIKVVADPSIVMELADHFTWKAPNYKFHPKFKMRIWDGNITLVNRLSGLVYFGLAKRIKKFCDLRGYTVTFDDQLIYEDVSEHELKKFMKSLNIPSEFESRDYQFNSILKCIRTGRRTLLSPTSSGKSLMIYVITQWYKQHKALIIVPTIGLVLQMAEDFKAYGYQGTLHLSTEGLSKSNDIDADVCITTWQSLNNGKTKMPKQWYNQFGVVFGDEAHGCKSASLINILSSLEHCKYRFGTTGTLDGNKCFTGESKVLTINGEKEIKFISNDDLVLSFNEKTNSLEYKRCNKLYNNGKSNTELFKIITENGTIECTEDHLIFTNKGWIKAKDLTIKHKIFIK